MTQLAIEEFIITNELETEPAELLRQCTEDIASKVVLRGPMTGCKHPLGLLQKRIQEAVADDGLDCTYEVEQFLAENMVDEKAQEILRSCTSSCQRMVIERGPVTDSTNPSAALMSRIKAAMSGGKGANNKGFDKGGKAYDKGGMKGGGMKGGGKCGKGKASNPWEGMTLEQMWCHEEASGPTPTVHWLSFGPTSSVVSYGMPPWCCALTYDKSMTVFQSSHHILSECVPDIATATRIEHDEDWKVYPDVGQTMKMYTGEENCFAIAFSVEHGVWGVGYAFNKKGRDAAARLALAVTLASGNPQLHAYLRAIFPDYRQLVDSPSVSCAAGGCGGGGCGGGGCVGYGGGGCGGGAIDWGEDDGAPAKKKKKTAGGGGGGAAAATIWDAGGGAEITIHTLDLPASVVPDGPFPVPALYHEKTSKSLYSSAKDILKKLLSIDDAGDDMYASMIEIRHDPEWQLMPEVAQALKPAGMEEDCYAVGSCPSLGKFAVGLHSGWDKREHAAQLALALSIAADSEQLPQTAMMYPEFGRLCSTAGIM